MLWRFCIPLFASVVFQQLYNIADSLVAGKFIGEAALAAVGNSYELTLFFIAFAFGCNIGCSVVVSRYFGAKDFSRMKSAVSTGMIASGILCAVLMAAGLLASGRLLKLIHTPEEIFRDSLEYMSIYVWGLPFLFFYNISTGIFSALGDSRTPFLFLACSSVANIAVDILFVVGFHMGVPGVAWATFLCQGVSCALALSGVFRRLKKVPHEGAYPKFSAPILRELVAIAVPSTIQQGFISVGNIIIQGAINSFGASVIAGYAAGVKLNNLVMTSFTTLANGISNYTAQNLGAKKPERVSLGFRAGIRMVWILCVPIVLVYFVFSRGLLGLFMDSPTHLAVETGVRFLRILTPFYFVVSVKLVSDGVLRGSGRMRQFMTGTFTDLILRTVLALILSRTALGVTGIWCAWPVGWCVSTAVSVLFYRQCGWDRAVPEDAGPGCPEDPEEETI